MRRCVEWHGKPKGNLSGAVVGQLGNDTGAALALWQTGAVNGNGIAGVIDSPIVTDRRRVDCGCADFPDRRNAVVTLRWSATVGGALGVAAGALLSSSPVRRQDFADS